MDTTSYWLDSTSLPRFDTLDKDVKVDVAVIGGGITGATAAYLLKRQGYTVALLERHRCAHIDTGHTTAHLTAVTDLRLHKLVMRFGKQRARATWEAGFAAIDQIVSNIRREEIDCDFKWVPGYLHAPIGGESSGRRSLERDAELAQEFGFQAEFLAKVPFFNVAGVKFANQAEFHPLKYVAALLRAIPGKGSYVFEHSEASEFKAKPLTVTAGKYKVRCNYVVLATHNPLMGTSELIPATLFQTKLFLYSSYAIGARVPAGVFPEALFWDTSEPYHYLRVDRRRGFDYAIFGGEDHKTGQRADPAGAFKRLRAAFEKSVPGAEITHRWSGQVIETKDGLPYIGETSERQFVATGFAGNGMTFGTLAGMMAVDAVLKRKNPWQELFAPNRKKFVGGTWNYLNENKDYPYYLVRDWLGGSEGNSLKALRRNQGKILNLKGKKVAAYRNGDGKVSLCSPVCTHMKCIIHWNDAEKTWDCPCHGSRFAATGEVLSGPAEEDLEEV